MASLGQWLREEREARSISLEEIAAATKIVPRYLEALENDRLDMMPGGFFVKGIIRTYAGAVGLDPEEVLRRYREAGLLSSGPEQGRGLVPKPPEIALPQIETPPPAAAPESPAEPIAPTTPSLAPAQKAEPPLLIEEAPQTRALSASLRRIPAWTWQALAVLAIGCAIFFVLRSIRSHRSAQPRPTTVVTQSLLPPAQKTEPTKAPQTSPTTEPTAAPGSQAASQRASDAAAKLEAPSVADEVWKGVTIEIVFQADTWIRVYTDGELKIDGLFPAGATARAHADETLLIHTGNPEGFTFRLNGKPAKPLRRAGQLLTDVKITPDNLRDFLEGPSSGLPAG